MPEYVNAFLILVFLVGVVLILPPDYDPAFWLKKWNERKQK